MRPPLWPALAAGVVAAVWIDLSPSHHGHQADSLVPVLASLQAWTPFYWGQDRFGMLLPLLAMPFKHPFVNLLVQGGLSAFAGLAALFLLPRFVLPERGWLLVGLVSSWPFLAWAPEEFRFTVLSTGQPYQLAAALGLAGLLLLDRPAHARPSSGIVATALGLLALAHWVNVASGLLLGPALVARWLAAWAGRHQQATKGDERHESRRGLPEIAPPTILAWLAVLGGFAAGLALKWLVRAPSTPTETRPLTEWLDGAGQLLQNAWSDLGPSPWPITAAFLAAAGLALLLVPSIRLGSAPSLWAALVLVGGALLGAVAMGASDWVEDNLFATRYLSFSLLLLQTALAIPAGRALAVALPRQRAAWLRAGTTGGLFLAVALGYDAPSLTEVRAVLDDRMGHRTADILAARCTHIAGNYWRVWPMVFHANLVSYERGERRTIWGVALRGGPTQRIWRRMPRAAIRIAVVPGDADADPYLQRSGLTNLVVVAKSDAIWVLRPAETVEPGEAIEPYPVRAVGP